MENGNHFSILEQGVEVWNKWRKDHPEIERPNLNYARFLGADFQNANFSKTEFVDADLAGSNFSGANLERADFLNARLVGCEFYGATMKSTIFYEADLTSAKFDNSIIERGIFTKADMEGASLINVTLHNPIFLYAKLRNAKLQGTIISNADFRGAYLENANMEKAILNGADLSLSSFVDVNLTNADISNSKIYGISAWNLNLTNAIQNDLIISKENEALIRIDDIEVAQFIYLMLNNQKITKVIGTLAKKGVLILGRFTEERKLVLDEMRIELRNRGYLPIVFDFVKPPDSNFTETIVTLAGMCLFVIADITNPRCSPLELHATIPVFNIPFVPIIKKGEEPFSMFKDLVDNNGERVIDLLYYSSLDKLKKVFTKAILEPALLLRNKINDKKSLPIKTRNDDDYL